MKRVLLASAVLGLAFPAAAATVTIDYQFSLAQGVQFPSGPPPFTVVFESLGGLNTIVSDGDILILNVTFDSAILATDLYRIQVTTNSGNNADLAFLTPSTLTLLGASTPLSVSVGSGGIGPIGAVANSSPPNLLVSGPVSFTGVSLLTTVDFLSSQSATLRNLDVAFSGGAFGGAALPPFVPAPEPSGWALMIAGVFGLGAVLRRQHGVRA